ncbi:MAG: DUF2914 domain-containing protein [Bacteroidetes bacterium]|nr:DUF2914 domain-containing protein [Bacteroidota bacterium]MDA0874075.1 DUF2914 domain-containing protein [Bacteroidota bacterium]
MMPFQQWIPAVREFYEAHEWALALTFFLAGILWDALTLRAIDNLVDNLILSGYLLALTAVLVLDLRLQAGKLKFARIQDPQVWLRGATQFLLGALLSAFVIFYSRSVTWSAHLAFWIILVVGAVLNEFLTRKVSIFPAQLAFLTFCSATMFAWLVPVLIGTMSLWVFRLSLLCSLLWSAGVFLYARKLGRLHMTRFAPLSAWIVPALLLFLDTGYRYSWIPPVPLSVQEGGVYNRVERQDDHFLLEWQTDRTGWFAPDYARTVYRAPGEPIYGFAAVFAPTRLKQTLVHEWQQWDDASEAWRTTDRIPYRLSGGREEGYRGTTFKQNVAPGRWRLVVATEEGKVLTRIPFEVAERLPDQPLTTRTVAR